MFLQHRTALTSTKGAIKPTVARFPHNRPITLATSRKCSHCKRQPFFDCRKRSAECRVSFCIRERIYTPTHPHTPTHTCMHSLWIQVWAQLETPTAGNKCLLPTQYSRQYTDATTQRRNDTTTYDGNFLYFCKPLHLTITMASDRAPQKAHNNA